VSEKMSTELLVTPRYSYQEADRLARTSRGTARRWLKGFVYRGSVGEPVARPPVTPRQDVLEAASFIDLVELAAIGRFREFGFSMPKIRNLVDACQSIFDVPRPLTSLQFKLGGRQVFVSHEDKSLVEVLKTRGQAAWHEVLEPFLQTLEYENDVVRRWFPLGQDAPIVVDPAFSFGLPVVAHSGIRTEILFERFEVGELTSAIARDFNIEPAEVERAVQFEVSRLQAA